MHAALCYPRHGFACTVSKPHCVTPVSAGDRQMDYILPNRCGLLCLAQHPASCICLVPLRAHLVTDKSSMYYPTVTVCCASRNIRQAASVQRQSIHINLYVI